MEFIEAAALWIAHRGKMVEFNLIAGSTWNNQSRILKDFMDEWANEPLRSIRKSHIELWAGSRAKTCKPVTISASLDVLRQFFNWCVDEQLLETAPRFPTVSVPNVEVELPSDEAFVFVLLNSSEHHSQALEFMLLTGLAPHELERLQVRDARARVADDMDGCPYEVGVGQRPDFPVKAPSRRRWVPMNARATSIWLNVCWHATQFYHPFPKVAAMEKAIQRLRRDTAPHLRPAGLEAITPKTMRKWFASKVSGDVAENLLQALLGHAPGSKVTRRHYVRSTAGERVAAVKGIGL